jgi:aminomuconate-semialdehyde/2-hydroxymuconate-6-semialdehyde dehydrogenase
MKLLLFHGLGHKVGDAITHHPGIKAISFTGGTKTGEIIARTAAPMFKKLSLELGGKNPNIIFADCDFEKALKTTLLSSFANQGQICLCGSRLFVQEEIYDKFRDALVAKTAKLKVGDPKDPSSNLGAVVSKGHMKKILAKIEESKKLGGKIIIGGKRVILDGELKEGYYIQPTIIEGLSSDCDVNQEEIFGPVVSIIPFKTEEEVIKMANSTKYGLSASLFTPELFIPPNGILRSRSIQVFTQTTPESILDATRCARLISRVKRLADKPYFVEFAIFITSSSVLNGIIDTTGPNISSRLVLQSIDNPSIIVGSIK